MRAGTLRSVQGRGWSTPVRLAARRAAAGAASASPRCLGAPRPRPRPGPRRPQAVSEGAKGEASSAAEDGEEGGTEDVLRSIQRALVRDGPRGNETAAQLQRLVDQAAAAADDSEGAQQVQVPDRDGTAGAGPVQLKGLTFEELRAWAVGLGEAPRRAEHVWSWVYGGSKKAPATKFIRSFAEAIGVPDGFGRNFLATVEAHGGARLDAGLELEEVHRANDGTRKLLFTSAYFADHDFAADSYSRIETVMIPIVRGNGRKPRLTVCVSSQVGCAMGCTFCFTGLMGLRSNLKTEQIVEQVLAAKRLQMAEDPDVPVTNIVFMGMGEPLNNLDAVVKSIAILTHRNQGVNNFSANKITVSTCGLVPEMYELCRRTRAQVALSLHATTDKIRDQIVPINRKYPISELVLCLNRCFPKKGTAAFAEGGRNDHTRYVLIEYLMLRGVNDSDADARRLLSLLEDCEAKVNLIEFNPHAGTIFEASPPERVRGFRSVLIDGGLVCTIRSSRGDDEMAACGQLGNDLGARGERALAARKRRGIAV